MKRTVQTIGIVAFTICLLVVLSFSPVLAAKSDKKAAGPAPAKGVSTAETWSKPDASFDSAKMSDMSNFDPSHWVNPEGDVINCSRLATFRPGRLERGYGLAMRQLAGLRHQSARRYHGGRKKEEDSHLQGGHHVQAGPGQEGLLAHGSPGEGQHPDRKLWQQHGEDPE